MLSSSIHADAKAIRRIIINIYWVLAIFQDVLSALVGLSQSLELIYKVVIIIISTL